LLALVALVLGAGPAGAAAASGPKGPLPPEPHDTGWALHLDNDALALVGRDQQYTGGIAVTLAGRRAAEATLSPMPWLEAIDATLGLADRASPARRVRGHALHFGVAAFTPEDIEAAEPLPQQRPYASLVFASATRRQAHLAQRHVLQRSLAVGVLGTDVAEATQSAIHRGVGSPVARGWDNQISDGGEPTIVYVITRYRTHAFHTRAGWGDYQVVSVRGASVGAVTQAGVGLAWRHGEIRSPWWAYTPGYTEFVSLGPPVSARGTRGGVEGELYVSAGISARYRLYNALLEGQFRDSAVTYGRGDLDETLFELDLGLTLGVAPRTALRATLRVRTPELEKARGDLPLWGSLTLLRRF
jgi:hypothetical protein